MVGENDLGVSDAQRDTEAIDFLCESSPLFSDLSSRLESGVVSFPFVTSSDCDVLVAMIVVPCQSVQGKLGPYHVTVPLPEGQTVKS